MSAAADGGVVAGRQVAGTASMRPACAATLLEAARADPALVVLGADGRALGADVAQHFPQRYLDVGVAEANLVGVASGLARTGLRPVVGTIAAFLVRRANEQIRNDVCNARLNVTFVGVGGGLSYGNLGATHHAVEDLGFFGSLPGTSVYCPADAHDAVVCLRRALAAEGPAYVRIGARPDPLVLDEHDGADDPRILRRGDDAVVFCAGGTVHEALRAHELLAARGIGTEVVAVACWKPLDAGAVTAVLRRHRTVVVAEEHVAAGGLGAALAARSAHCGGGVVRSLSIDDRYPPVGDRAALLSFYGIDAAGIARAVEEARDRRRVGM